MAAISIRYGCKKCFNTARGGHRGTMLIVCSLARRAGAGPHAQLYAQEAVRELMIYCGKRDDAPNIPGFSGYRSIIIPQIREYLGSSSTRSGLLRRVASTSLAAIPVI